MPESTSKWRERAKEMRAEAAAEQEPEARAIMLKLADLYDHLADIRQGTAQSEFGPKALHSEKKPP